MREAFWPSVFGALVFLVSLTALLGPVRRTARLPLTLAAPIALALLVCFEALLVNALSLTHAVTRGDVLAGHLVLVAACLVPAPRAALGQIRSAITGRTAWSPGRFGLVLIPLAALAALSAVRYAPNNFDAMTYHLARVAHWIQHRSVGAYPTGIQRQLVLPAGSDYLLLLLQEVSESDRLANLLQFGCYALVVLAAPTLARLVGTPRRLSGFAAILVATLPMSILQASSAQNDLVASVMAVAMVGASLSFAHTGHPVPRPISRVLLLAATMAAGVLVKPTALFAAAPFLVLVGVATAVRLKRGFDRFRPYAFGALLALALVAPVCLPEIIRRNVYEHAPDLAREFSYPLVGRWADRTVNSLRGLAHHIPPPRRWAGALSEFTGKDCSPEIAAVCVTTQFRAHEDLVGNPVQAILAVAAVALAIFRRGSPRRARLAVACLLAAWLLFHGLLQDNPWIQRLELPLFVLQPMSLGVLLPGTANSRSRRALAAVGAAGALLLADALFVAVRNELSPPFGPAAPYERSYYDSFHSQFAPQETALRFLASRNCLRLGLSLSEVGYDYPLTWRAMQLGATVHHVSVSDPWPCLLYSDHGEPPGARAAGWVPLAGLESEQGKDVPFLFGRSP